MPSRAVTITVAPGIVLPEKGSAWAFQSVVAPRLVHLYHTSVSLNNHSAKNLIGSSAGSFLYRPMFTAEIKGTRAEVRLQDTRPTFYLRAGLFDDDDRANSSAEPDGNDLVILHLEVGKDKRVIESASVNAFGRDAKRQVSIVESDIQTLDDGWVRLTLKAQLSKGEYAIVPLPKRKQLFADSVYDFGVD